MPGVPGYSPGRALPLCHYLMPSPLSHVHPYIEVLVPCASAGLLLCGQASNRPHDKLWNDSSQLASVCETFDILSNPLYRQAGRGIPCTVAVAVETP